MPPVDRDVVARKLEQLRHHVARIDSKKPLDAAALAGDEDPRDIVVFNLVQAVEVCVEVGMHIVSETELPPPESMGDVFDPPESLGVLAAEPGGGGLARRLRQAVGTSMGTMTMPLPIPSSPARKPAVAPMAR